MKKFLTEIPIRFNFTGRNLAGKKNLISFNNASKFHVLFLEQKKKKMV